MPPDDTVPQQPVDNSEILEKQKQKTEEVTQATESFTQSIKQNQQSSFSWQDTLVKNAQVFSVLSTAVTQTSDKFRNLSILANGGLPGVNSFSDSFKSLTEVVKSLPTDLAFNVLTNVGKAFGVGQEELQKFNGSVQAVGAGLNFLSQKFNNLLVAADNIKSFREAMVMTAATTGRLNELYEDGGDKLQDLNKIAAGNIEYLGRAGAAMHLNAEQLSSYFFELRKIPRAFDEVRTAVAGSNNATGEFATDMDVVQKVIQLSVGTGRNFADILDDLNQTMLNYNTSMDEAIRYSSQISAVTEKINYPLVTVENTMKGVSEAFKFFGLQTDASRNILEKFGEAFNKTKLGAGPASELIGSITKRISDLDVAQRSFLSQQTGGPGGLMGGFRITKLLREGKTDEVLGMMKQSLERQFGRIVSVDEASKSEAAASQLQKQIMMLTKGPFGSVVQSEDQATRLLDAFKAMGRGGLTKVNPEILTNDLGNQLDRGRQVQNLSNTRLTSLAADASQIAQGTQTIAGNTVTNALAIGGIKQTDEGKADAENLLAKQDVAAKQATEFRQVANNPTMYSDESLLKKGLERGFESVTDAVKIGFSGIAEEFKKVLKSDSDKGSEQAFQNLIAQKNSLLTKEQLTKEEQKDKLYEQLMKERMDQSKEQTSAAQVSAGRMLAASVPGAQTPQQDTGTASTASQDTQITPFSRMPKIPIEGTMNVKITIDHKNIPSTQTISTHASVGAPGTKP